MVRAVGIDVDLLFSFSRHELIPKIAKGDSNNTILVVGAHYQLQYLEAGRGYAGRRRTPNRLFLHKEWRVPSLGWQNRPLFMA